MHTRSRVASLVALTLTLLAPPGASQESSPLNWTVHQGRPRFGGTYHVATRAWTRRPGGGLPAPAEGALDGTVYDNTCLWTGAAPNTVAYNAVEACESVWDNGRVPFGGGPFDVGDSLVDAVTFAHVTFAPVGTVDVRLEFFDELGGDCLGLTPPGPPAPTPTGSVVLNAANGVTLPGDPTGAGTPWFLTIDLSGGGEFCLRSEGDGTPNSGADSFTWSFRHGNSTAGVPGAGGPVIAGEPMRGAFGSCTFSLACGTDPVVGPCGTGLSQFDGYWQNVDGDPAGPTGGTNTSVVCPSPPTTAGTGCFFFGGWPGNPWSGYFLRLDRAGCCMCSITPGFYCTSKTTSDGCIPFLTTDAGFPAVSSTTAWNVRSNDMRDGESGFLVYSFKKSNLGFHGGKLCVKAPFVRSPIAKAKQVPCLGTGTCVTKTCSQLRRNFNATVQGGSDPGLTAGRLVYAQMRQRDPADPTGFGDNLSDGVYFLIAP